MRQSFLYANNRIPRRTGDAVRVVAAVSAAVSIAGCFEPKLEVDPSMGNLGTTGGQSTAAGGQGGTTSSEATGGTTVEISSTGAVGGTQSQTSTAGMTSAVSTGGVEATGGATPTGGNGSVGGVATTGGALNTGGANSQGGSDSGGAPASNTNSSLGGITSSVGGAATGGVVSDTGGAAATGGTSAASTTSLPPCLGSPLPILDGPLNPSNNACDINGNWHWYKDSPGDAGLPETVVTAPPPNQSPVVKGSGKVCLEGNTVADPTFAAWGAGFVLDFNNTGTKGAYDAGSHNIGGFEVVVSGTFPQGLRVQFDQANAQPKDNPAFVPIAVPGTYRIRFADAFVPKGRSTTNGGAGVDPRQLGSIGFFVVGGSVAADFNFCLESIAPLPINDDGSLGTRPVRYIRVPLDSAASVAPNGNLGIQGLYSCIGPPNVTITCGASATSANPYRNATAGMCVSGMTTTDPNNWGAILQLSLNQTPPSPDLGVYDAAAHRVRGFRIDMSNTSPGFLYRVSALSALPKTTNFQPPFEEFPQPGQHLVEFGNLQCPNWQNITCPIVDPTYLYALQVQLASTNEQKSFDLCVSNIEAEVEQ